MKNSLPTKVKNRWSKQVDKTIILNTFRRNVRESLYTNFEAIWRFGTFDAHVNNENI